MSDRAQQEFGWHPVWRQLPQRPPLQNRILAEPRPYRIRRPFGPLAFACVGVEQIALQIGPLRSGQRTDPDAQQPIRPLIPHHIEQHVRHPDAVQIEIDRGLYMNERTIRPSAGYGGFRALLDGVIAELAGIGRVEGLRVAAE